MESQKGLHWKGKAERNQERRERGHLSRQIYSIEAAVNDTSDHGLIHYIDTKAKCRHLKKLPVKGLCGRCLSVRYPPPPFTHCIRTCTFTQGRGAERTREKVRETTVHKLGRKYQHGWLYLQSITLINACRKGPLQVNVFRLRHFALVSM